ncbi:MAG: type II toxin-antitoxin system prevent-host-death family antitoxin [Nocardioides sp.]
MRTAGLRELRQQASDLVRRAEAGERITVTVSGRAAAELGPARGDRTWRAMADLTALFDDSGDEAWESDRDLVGQEISDPFAGIER